ncbi:MAG: hypothetical protein H6842_10845 [Rhodospirillaceae bacterium]|nr:hypothetical protein [Rhodospirillaceae bacterium]
MSDTKKAHEDHLKKGLEYDEAAHAHAASGKVDAAADAARRAIEGDEKAELDKARAKAAKHAAEHDPLEKHDPNVPV